MDAARILSQQFAWKREFEILEEFTRALRGKPSSYALNTDLSRARAVGKPYDPERIQLFNEMKVALAEVAYHTLLERFVLARFLARLSQSAVADRFVLKGAQLFRLWNDTLHRPTRDADFLDYEVLAPERLAQVMDEICALTPVHADALLWQHSTVSPIRAEHEDGGNRVKITALLSRMQIHLQIDVGYGDIVTPPPKHSQWPGILDFPAVPLVTYPVETVIAEKLEAMVSLGLANSRMKDF